MASAGEVRDRLAVGYGDVAATRDGHERFLRDHAGQSTAVDREWRRSAGSSDRCGSEGDMTTSGGAMTAMKTGRRGARSGAGAGTRQKPTRADRVAQGKEARAVAPLDSHAEFGPGGARDPVGVLLGQAGSGGAGDPHPRPGAPQPRAPRAHRRPRHGAAAPRGRWGRAIRSRGPRGGGQGGLRVQGGLPGSAHRGSGRDHQR